MTIRILFLIALSLLMLSSNRNVAEAGVPPSLVGNWIQEQMGPVVTHERVYRFNADGTYLFLFTARNTGSVTRKTLVRETGKFALRGNRLVMSPKTGASRAYLWRIERDPYVGDLRLVFVLPDGVLDVYYRS